MSDTKTKTSTSTSEKIAEKFQPRPLKRMDRAMMVLSNAGIPIPVKNDSAISAAGLVKDLLVFGNSDVNAIVRVLSDIQTFNEIVRDNLKSDTAGERYVNIAKDMNSIREDTKRMTDQIEDGKMSISDRLQNSWMVVRRGSVSKRFQRVRNNATMIHKSSEDTISRMRAIVNGYTEARGAVQEARTIADQIRERAREKIQADQEALVLINDEVQRAQADANFPSIELNQLLSKRDDQVSVVKEADRLFQIAEDLYNNLTVAYSAGDQVMERIRQTSDVHERIYSQSVTFFTTNEVVFTALEAAYIQLRSVNEISRGHEVLKKSMNQAMEDLGSTGNTILLDAVRQGYGPTLEAASLEKLVSSIEKFQTDSVKIRDEMREKASQNSKDMEALSEASRKRMAELLVQQNLPQRDRPLERPQLGHDGGDGE